MVRFVAGVFLTIAVLCVAQAVIVLGVPAPVAAEYWIPQMVSVKEGLLAEQSSPRIIFLGGSTTLFGLDANRVSDVLHVNAMNMGFHGGLRLDRLMMVARANVRRGDVLVMPLEPYYYDCSDANWTAWQVRNGVAWDRANYFDKVPLAERLVAVWTGSDPMLPIEVLTAALEYHLQKAWLKERLEILNPSVPALTLFKARSDMQHSQFAYSAFNMDDRGDILNTTGANYFGAPSDLSAPDKICPAVAEQLKLFDQEMEARGVRAFLANTPYLVEGADTKYARSAESEFMSSLQGTGLTILDKRDELIFSREDFFNTETHLNAMARELRTDRLIAHLRAYLRDDMPHPKVGSDH